MTNPNRFYASEAAATLSDRILKKNCHRMIPISTSFRSTHQTNTVNLIFEDVPVSPNNDSDDEQSNNIPNTWFNVDGTRHKQFLFADNPGIHGLSGISPPAIKPIDVYSKLETDDVYKHAPDQTNLIAQLVIINRRVSRKSQLKRWKDTDTAEMGKWNSFVHGCYIVHGVVLA